MIFKYFDYSDRERALISRMTPVQICQAVENVTEYDENVHTDTLELTHILLQREVIKRRQKEVL